MNFIIFIVVAIIILVIGMYLGDIVPRFLIKPVIFITFLLIMLTYFAIMEKKDSNISNHEPKDRPVEREFIDE